MHTRVPEILIVEDELAASSLLENYLKNEGWHVQIARSSRGVTELLARKPIDLIFLDRRLADGDSLPLCRRIRAQSPVGIIFTTVVDDEVERLIGLESGADAYYSKPLPMRELLVTSRNLIDRVRGMECGQETAGELPDSFIWDFENWSFDPFQHSILGAGGSLERLTRNECRLLAALVERPGRFLTRDELLEAIYDSPWCENTRIIDVLIGRLRRKLGTVVGDEPLIRSQYGGGYLFSAKGRRIDQTDP